MRAAEFAQIYTDLVNLDKAIPESERIAKEEMAEEPKTEIKQVVKEEEISIVQEEQIQKTQPVVENGENKIVHKDIEPLKHTDKKEHIQKKKKLEHHGIKLPLGTEAKVAERVNEIMGVENIEDKKEENSNE